ncbi:MAG: dihydropteroate synthase, partial [Succinivibrio sp.]
MKLKLPGDKTMDLSYTKVIGTIALQENDSRSIEDFVLMAKSFVKSGAELLEIGASLGENGINEDRVASVVGAVLNAVDVPVAVNSNSLEVVSQTVRAGVSMVITSNGLATPGMMDFLKDSDVLICLHYDPQTRIKDEDDVVAMVSEYFFERIDACLEAGIQRKRLVIDPSVVNASVSVRLKLLGRLESFKSFALPILVAMPRQIPTTDVFMVDNHVLSLTTALFCASDKSVQFIRTSDVSEVAIAIGFWEIMAS